ncbi:ribbon-helix-helix protein, CopG family [Candidatus Palauibacter sp.]|uniref:ribbon-helix-helix protein, CopG family n=1 Tax=Candidatus Palauibacter sp. TaxID=3101350 RepID=UPI003C6EC77A
MSLRTVRLDEEEEAILEDLRQKTGCSISEVLRRGLRSYDTTVNGFRLGRRTGETFGEALRRATSRRDDELAALPPRPYKEAVVEAIRKKHAL